MTAEEIAPESYARLAVSPYFVFGSAAFNQLNEDKAERVFYLAFKDTKFRLGIVGGVSGGVFSSPFSAPFGGFVSLAGSPRLSHLEEAVDALEAWLTEKNIGQIKVTLPPAIYETTFISTFVNIFFRKGYQVGNVELNHYFDLAKFSDRYPDTIWRNARKNLRIALSNNLSFRQCNPEERLKAYEIIRHNRKVRGVPLRMSWEQVDSTSHLMEAHFFLVSDVQGTDIAAAVVFVVAEGIAQVIYWGDIPDFASLKTMNFLSYKVFEFYKNRGFRFVDIGPSTENSVPNYGLCEFKESIGCDVADKFTFTRKFS